MTGNVSESSADPRKAQIENARRQALAKQRELVKLRSSTKGMGDAIDSQITPSSHGTSSYAPSTPASSITATHPASSSSISQTSLLSGSSGASSAAASSSSGGMSTIALAKNSRLEAVAKARELARQQQKEKLQVREAQHQQQQQQQQQHQESAEKRDEVSHDEREEDNDEDHRIGNIHEVEKGGRSSSVGEDEESYHTTGEGDVGGNHRVGESDVGGSAESCDDIIPELEDALRMEEEEIRAAERIRHLQIEQARAQQRSAAGGTSMSPAEREQQLAKAKKLKKKKKPTFWDTLFMCGSEAEGAR